jgi:hypothetical protein
MTPEFKRVKMVHALDSVATVIGTENINTIQLLHITDVIHSWQSASTSILWILEDIIECNNVFHMPLN